MDRSLEEKVRRRAGFRCEYCCIPDSYEWLRFQIDHIIALKHGGQTTTENLAWSCFHCNSYKGPNVAGIDPETGKLVALFHPRRDSWTKHFAWLVAALRGQTPVGRATIQVLWVNHPRLIALRSTLIAEGAFPP